MKRSRLEAHRIPAERQRQEQLLSITYLSLKLGSCPPQGQIPPLEPPELLPKAAIPGAGSLRAELASKRLWQGLP